MSAESALRAFTRRGGRLWLDADTLRYEAPVGVASPAVLDRLREAKPEVIALIQQLAGGYSTAPDVPCAACRRSVGWFPSEHGDWRCRLCFETEAKRTDPDGRRSVFLANHAPAETRQGLTIERLIKTLDLMADPRPPVEAPACSDAFGHRWTRAGGGGICRLCGVRAAPRRSYRGSTTRPATSRQASRVGQLAAMDEIPPDLAADTQDRMDGKLTERCATKLIAELGDHIARARNAGESP